MKNHTKILIIVFLQFFSNLLESQPLSFSENQKAHRKYWFYRTRMINDFIKIGGEQGDCIVLSERNLGLSDTTAKAGTDQIDITNQYLSALALEYKLLTRNNQNTDETIKELFYLIKTINRLDSRADNFFGSTPITNENMNVYNETSNLNGFMMREDMPSTYIKKNYAHYNYELLENGYDGLNPSSVPNPLTSYKSFTGLNHITKLDDDNQFSNYVDFGNGDKPLIRMSLPHDKYYSMFVAFMFIVKYIPNVTTYSENGVIQAFQDGETSIRQEVIKIANRCHPYLRSNTFGFNISNWVMEYPDGTTNNVDLGVCQPFSYPLTRTICHINNSFPWSVAGCASYSDLFAESSYNAFGVLCQTSGFTDDLSVFIANNQASSNIPIVPTGFVLPIPMWIVMNWNSSVKNMEWAELLRMVLHQKGDLLKSKSAFATPINKAPCTGPYNFDLPNNPDDEWSSPDRLEHPKRRGVYPPQFPGNYPGVDYMLLHNLYYEYLNQLDDKPSGSETGAYKNAYNLMDNEDHSIWPKKIGPMSPFIIGISTFPHKVAVFQNLKSTAHIYAKNSPAAPMNFTPSDITYRAGKEIRLLPGFQVDSGSTFRAHIKRYVCGVDDYEAGMRTAKDTTESNDYESDAMNETAMHYVEYPKSDSDNNPYGSEEEMLENEQPNFENDMQIVPNPSSGIFTVQIKKLNEDETLNIHVYDMKGNLILQFTNVSVNTEINLQNFSKGIYMVHLNSSTGISTIKKVSIVD